MSMTDLRQRIRACGLTQRELADACGTSPSNISRIVKLRHQPSPKLAMRIEQATGGQIRATELLGIELSERAP